MKTGKNVIQRVETPPRTLFLIANNTSEFSAFATVIDVVQIEFSTATANDAENSGGNFLLNGDDGQNRSNKPEGAHAGKCTIA